MKHRTFKIYGITVDRVSKRKARTLCETPDTPVFMTLVNENPNSPWCDPYHLNFYPVSNLKFEQLIAQYLFYNRCSQFGYYPAFYAQIEDAKK